MKRRSTAPSRPRPLLRRRFDTSLSPADVRARLETLACAARSCPRSSSCPPPASPSASAARNCTATSTSAWPAARRRSPLSPAAPTKSPSISARRTRGRPGSGRRPRRRTARDQGAPAEAGNPRPPRARPSAQRRPLPRLGGAHAQHGGPCHPRVGRRRWLRLRVRLLRSHPRRDARAGLHAHGPDGRRHRQRVRRRRDSAAPPPSDPPGSHRQGGHGRGPSPATRSASTRRSTPSRIPPARACGSTTVVLPPQRYLVGWVSDLAPKAQ